VAGATGELVRHIDEIEDATARLAAQIKEAEGLIV
jgi:hypothetical protein